MAQRLNQVPPNLEVWEADGRHFLVRLIPDTDPPIPLAWFVSSSADARALGIKKADRTFASLDEFYATGALRHGNTTELANTTEDPWEQIQSNYEAEVRVKPWLADPEILSIWYGAALEGRGITEAELQGTEWWRTHTEEQRSWISLNASDPATAENLIQDNRARVADMLSSAGVDNASDDLVQTIADKWTTGDWTQIYATNQIELLADPNLQGDLDTELRSFIDGLDTNIEGEDVVREMINTWLGPVGAQGWTDEHIGRWASKFRESNDARSELTNVLKRHRLALFPEYSEPGLAELTYEDIAAPWRGVWQTQLGQVADETDPRFSKLIRMNDRAQAEAFLRKEGLKEGNKTVADRLLSDLGAAFGGQVRRSDPAVL